MRSQNSEEWSYKKTNKKIVDFDTIEKFWTYYQHIVRPDRLPTGAQFLIFHEGIFPAWESGKNIGGGRFAVNIKKEYANKIWEDIILHFIGDDCDQTDKICGIRLNVKREHVNFQIWTEKIYKDEIEDIVKWFKDAIGFSN